MNPERAGNIIGQENKRAIFSVDDLSEGEKGELTIRLVKEFNSFSLPGLFGVLATAAAGYSMSYWTGFSERVAERLAYGSPRVEQISAVGLGILAGGVTTFLVISKRTNRRRADIRAFLHSEGFGR